MAAPPSFVLAVDAGGTHTRVACFALDGALLGEAHGAGGSLYHDADAAEHLDDAVIRCLEDGGLRAPGAAALAAGLSGIGRPGSNQESQDTRWSERIFAGVPGLDCPRVVVNDATTAHRGALLGAPGVVVLAGTGSMILAITEDGTEVESGHFEHYAGGARHLAFDAVQLVLTARGSEQDRPFVAAVLDHWGAADLDGLRRALLDQVSVDRRDVRRHYGALAPVVTAMADRSPLADRALRMLVDRTALGVRLLLPLIPGETVPVSTIGAVATDRAFGSRLEESLAGTRARRSPAALDAVRGAALIAFDRAGVPVDDEVVARLRSSQR